MTIYTHRQYVFSCDNCDRIDTDADIGMRDAIKTFRKDGWSIGKKHLCPDCSKKGCEEK